MGGANSTPSVCQSNLTACQVDQSDPFAVVNTYKQFYVNPLLIELRKLPEAAFQGIIAGGDPVARLAYNLDNLDKLSAVAQQMDETGNRGAYFYMLGTAKNQIVVLVLPQKNNQTANSDGDFYQYIFNFDKKANQWVLDAQSTGTPILPGINGGFPGYVNDNGNTSGYVNKTGANLSEIVAKSFQNYQAHL